MNTPQNILRRDAVERLTGLSKTTLYDLMSKRDFPRPIKLGARAVGWLERDIAAWQASRVEARETATAA